MSLLKMVLGADAPRAYDPAFRVVTYTGTGAEQSITGVGFKPDLVWIKSTNLVDNHWIFDSVRGPNKYLSSNTLSGESITTNGGVSSFDSDGFTLSPDTAQYANFPGINYVAWCWKASGSGAVTNNDGSTEGQADANLSAGFSIVKYTSSGDGTVGHGLGVKPDLVISKARDSAEFWRVHTDVSGVMQVGVLDTAAPFNLSGFGSPSDTVFSHPNLSADMVSYCFASVPGKLKIGSYTGNGSTDGPEIDCGFPNGVSRLMIKRTDSTGSWIMRDRKRGPYNPNTETLAADLPNAEWASADSIDLTTSGFKLLYGGADINSLAGTYIYIAFAEQPDEPPEVEETGGFNEILWEGNGQSLHALTGLGFSPDLVWYKMRNNLHGTTSNYLIDSIRGPANVLHSDSYMAEYFNGTSLIGIGHDGFSVGSHINGNENGGLYAGWAWNMGNKLEYDTAGSIPCLRKTNIKFGQSIVAWRGTGVSGTIAHGLGKPPKFMIIKEVNGDRSWRVYHASLGNGTALYLEGTVGGQGGSGFWNDTTPTNDVFAVGADVGVNEAGYEFIAYCFADIPGYSAFGSYLGDGTTDGSNAVDIGFRPDFLIVKRWDADGANWPILDSKRGGFGDNNTTLYANLSDTEAETTTLRVGFTDTGFKLLGVSNDINTNGGSYIYSAFKFTDKPGLHLVETGDLLLSDSLTDDNGNATVTVNGSPTLNTSNPIAGVNSLQLANSTGDFLQSDWVLDATADEFTIDFWYVLDTVQTSAWLATYIAGSGGWQFYYNHAQGAIELFSGSANRIAWSPEAGVPYHIALVKANTDFRLYIDGVYRGSFALSSMPNAGRTIMTVNSTLANTPASVADCTFDMIRVTEGKALWTTTNFNLSDKGLYYPPGTLNI
jgi:hypothetical protein